jgi:hypothetical protein
MVVNEAALDELVQNRLPLGKRPAFTSTHRLQRDSSLVPCHIALSLKELRRKFAFCLSRTHQDG